MTIYDVIDKIDNMDNMDKISDILDQWQFQTSVHTEEVIQAVKQSTIEIAQMGESRLYEWIKRAYQIKL